MKKKAVMAFLLGSAHVLCADVYYNAKTFSESETTNETVYIGHERATDGGDPLNALVTVKSGAVWTNTQNVVLGATANGSAHLTVEDGASVNFATLNVAFNGDNVSGIQSVFELQENARAAVTNVTVVYGQKKVVGNSGIIRLAARSIMSGICSFNAGSTNCTTKIELEGGEMEFHSRKNASYVSMYIGYDYLGRYTSCVLSGWGIVGFDNANLIMNNPTNENVDRGTHTNGQFRLYGQVIADGKGVARDLDFSHAGVPVTLSTQNRCGTNGWYAVNKGRLLMPRFPFRWASNSQYIGGYPYSHYDNELVNSFRYVFDDATHRIGGKYVFAELYATDRDDIPEGLPANSRRCLSSIWRIGYFDLTKMEKVNHNIRNKNLRSAYTNSFETVRLTFHYDPRLAKMEDVDIVKVYRCADEDSGEWECVGTAIPSSADPFVQTEDFGPASDLYNFGWLAIVGEKLAGTVITVR